MTKEFLKSNEIELMGPGYLTSKKDGKPVNNVEFVKCQQTAEYIITFAKMAKNKDFKGKQADSLSSFRNEVSKMLYSEKTINYINEPSKPKMDNHDKLVKEALSFINYENELDKNNKINEFLQQFNVLREFEEFGLFFDQDIVKLNKIYTVKEIIDAVKEVIDLI